jgi:hypothetical protein
MDFTALAIIGGIALAVGLLAMSKSDKDKKKKKGGKKAPRVVVRTPKTQPASPPKTVEELIKTPTAKVVGGGTGTPQVVGGGTGTPQVVGGGTGTQTKAMDDDPAPADDVPEGWYREGNGKLYKIRDPEALYNFDVARKTKHINLAEFAAQSQLGRRLKFIMRDKAVRRPHKYHNQLFMVSQDKSFIAEIAGSSKAKRGVLYLCDQTGKVHDFCISADGKRRGEHNIAYTKGMFDTDPSLAWVVQVSDGEGLAANYYPASVLPDGEDSIISR